MSDEPDRSTASDAPWNDAPADSDAIPGTEEPDPAEVVGEEGEEYDLASRSLDEPRDSYQRDTLDERLAEEEPEAGLRSDAEPEAGTLMAPERAGDDVIVGEDDADAEFEGEVDEPSAEDAAVHIQED
jgi:hypothetical protein